MNDDTMTDSAPFSLVDGIAGCLLGTAVGDALGLPYEGISRRRQRKLFPPGTRLRYRLLAGGWGMISDDTEHACITDQALAISGGEVDVFQRDLGRRFRWWVAALPAGIGWATLRSGVKLWAGFTPARSGVFSAGNGPAMRAPILGVAWGHDDPERLRALVRVSTRMTHTDPKAEWGALAVAVAARVSLESRRAGGFSREVLGSRYLQRTEALIGPEGGELIVLLRQAVTSATKGESTEEFADSLGLHRGISGYIFHTVAVAVHAWLSHPDDYEATITAAVRCGGDTDTVAAIAGGIAGGIAGAGSGTGADGIPGEWIGGLLEWPRTTPWLEKLAGAVAESFAGHIAAQRLLSGGRAHPRPEAAAAALLNDVRRVTRALGRSPLK